MCELYTPACTLRIEIRLLGHLQGSSSRQFICARPTYGYAQGSPSDFKKQVWVPAALPPSGNYPTDRADGDDDDAGVVAFDLALACEDGGDANRDGIGRCHTGTSGAGDFLRCIADESADTGECALRRSCGRGNGAVDQRRDGGAEVCSRRWQPSLQGGLRRDEGICNEHLHDADIDGVATDGPLRNGDGYRFERKCRELHVDGNGDGHGCHNAGTGRQRIVP